MTRVLYPGSFNPITKGHMNIIEQASKIFDEVIIAVLQNPSKTEGLFTIEERLKLEKKLYEEKNNIKVITGECAVDIALLNDCKAILRGIRNFNDFDYEAGIREFNKDISNNQINTICLFADKEYAFISSTAVKEIFNLGKDISKYVDPLIEQKMLIKKRGI